jgi:hypothetical protein
MPAFDLAQFAHNPFLILAQALEPILQTLEMRLGRRVRRSGSSVGRDGDTAEACGQQPGYRPTTSQAPRPHGRVLQKRPHPHVAETCHPIV